MRCKGVTYFDVFLAARCTSIHVSSHERIPRGQVRAWATKTVTVVGIPVPKALVAGQGGHELHVMVVVPDNPLVGD